MAALHYKRHQLRRCFNVWNRWRREETSQREIACEAELRKEKMSSLLQAVRRKGEKQPRPQQPTPPTLPPNPQQPHSAPEVSLITSKIVRQELVSAYALFTVTVSVCSFVLGTSSVFWQLYLLVHM